jgi:high-affinity iron transporter
VLPTFVIGLREGLEAALIVGIVAAFLRQRGRRDALRWVWAGVGAAVLLCVAAGTGLTLLSENLPQRQQEGLETVIGAFAVAMITYMAFWMRRHSRGMKGELERAADTALAGGSAWALVAMAFLAVLREGLETAVFLLAALNEAQNRLLATSGALLGILLAVALGWAIYRGGVRINLSRFFRVTGVVLVLVAAGLVLTALHTAHEAGWLNAGQRQTFDLSWLAAPGSVRASLFTGVLGVQPHPTVIEVAGWLVYFVPLVLYVAWPPAWTPSARTATRALFAAAGVSAAAALVVAVTAPEGPGPASSVSGTLRWRDDNASMAAPATLRTRHGAHVRAEQRVRLREAPSGAPRVEASWSLRASDGAVLPRPAPLRTRLGSHSALGPATGLPGGAAAHDYHGWHDELAGSGASGTLHYARTERHGGITTRVYTDQAGPAPVPASARGGLPATADRAQLERLGGGRLPLGVSPQDLPAHAPLGYADSLHGTWWIEPSTGRVVDGSVHLTRSAVLKQAGGVVLGQVMDTHLRGTPASLASAARAAAQAGDSSRTHALLGTALPVGLGSLGVLLAAAGALARARARRTAGGSAPPGAGRVAAAGTPPTRAAPTAPASARSQETSSADT